MKVKERGGRRKKGWEVARERVLKKKRGKKKLLRFSKRGLFECEKINVCAFHIKKMEFEKIK